MYSNFLKHINFHSLLKFISKNKSEIIGTSSIIAIFFSAISEFYFIPFIILLVFILYKNLNEKSFILFSIVILISFTGEALDPLRDYFTVVAIAGLLLFFLKKYGLNFKSYPLPPKLLLYLWAIFLFTVAFITFVNGFHLRGIDALFRSTIFFSICYFLYSFLSEKDNKFNHYYLILGLFIASLILSITVYYELYLSGLTIFLIEGFFARFGGAYGNYNTLAFVMAVNIIISVIALYSPKISSKVKIFFIPLFLLNNLFVIFLTNSRASILSFIIAMLFLFYHLNRKVIAAFFVAVLLFLMLYFF
jgi:hypothetical protein